jgi:hypothetical protein
MWLWKHEDECGYNMRAPPLFGREVTEFLNKTVKDNGLEEMDRWPSLSPNLNPEVESVSWLLN